MLLIFGWKVRSKALGEVTFFCPRCGADRVGQRMQMRRWFTLFFIPLIPLNVVGEFVQCSTCDGKFDEKVLALPTNAQITDNLQWATRHAVADVLRSGSRTERQRSIATDGVRSFGVSHFDPGVLDMDLATLNPADTGAWVRHAAESMNEQGRERLLRLCADVLAQEPNPANSRGTVEAIGQMLNMTPAHIAGVLAEALSAAPRPQGQ